MYLKIIAFRCRSADQFPYPPHYKDEMDILKEKHPTLFAFSSWISSILNKLN